MWPPYLYSKLWLMAGDCSGLPPYHPDVLAQGYDGDKVAAGLKAQLAELVNAGYNSKELFWGPEEVGWRRCKIVL